MTRIPDGPQFLPMAEDAFTEGDYAVVPDKVAEVVSHEPAHMRRVWDEVARDGYVSKRDAALLDRAMGDIRLFGRTLKDGTDTVEARFMAMRLADGRVRFDPAVRLAYERELAARQARLEKGEVLSGTFQIGDTVHELTEGVIDMPYDEFMRHMTADKWAVNLADYRGGDVRVTERDAEGRVIRQRERMVTETPFSAILPQFFEPNDMTKVEEISHGPNATTVKWEVLDSVNKTTLKDIGELRFIRMGDKTKVELESEHIIDAFPGALEHIRTLPPVKAAYDGAIALVMRNYFSDCLRRYQDLAAGRAELNPTPRPGPGAGS